MQKYHIKKDGTPGICRAKPGNCPLGGENEHYNSIEEAQQKADILNMIAVEKGKVNKSLSQEDRKIEDLLKENNKEKIMSFIERKHSEKYDNLRTRAASMNGFKEKKMDKTELLKTIMEPDGGCSYFMQRGTIPTGGFMVSDKPELSYAISPGKTQEEIEAAVERYYKENEEFFEENPDYALGLWNDPYDGTIYIDASRNLKDASDSRTLCQEKDQIAFFDLQTFESVTVNQNATSGGQNENIS